MHTHNIASHMACGRIQKTKMLKDCCHFPFMFIHEIEKFSSPVGCDSLQMWIRIPIIRSVFWVFFEYKERHTESKHQL